MIETNKQTIDKLKLINSIAEYHNITLSLELRTIWVDDLKPFSAQEIRSSWNEWRSQQENDRKRPKSHEIVRNIVNKKRAIAREAARAAYVDKYAKAKRGVCDLTDMMLDNVEKMNRTTANLLRKLEDCKTTYEKLTLCATALEKPELVNSSLFKSL